MNVFKQMHLTMQNGWPGSALQGLGNYKAKGLYLAQLLREAGECILVKFQLGEMFQVATEAAPLAQGINIFQFIGRKV